MLRHRRLSLGLWRALAAATMALAPTTAIAQYYDGHHDDRRGAWHDDERGDPRGGDRDRRGYPRGHDRHRCRNGSGGTILGAIAGGLLGNALAGRGDRTAGALLGGGAGALAGSAIGRDC